MKRRLHHHDRLDVTECGRAPEGLATTADPDAVTCLPCLRGVAHLRGRSFTYEPPVNEYAANIERSPALRFRLGLDVAGGGAWTYAFTRTPVFFAEGLAA